jgi:hypothetical protein
MQAGGAAAAAGPSIQPLCPSHQEIGNQFEFVPEYESMCPIGKPHLLCDPLFHRPCASLIGCSECVAVTKDIVCNKCVGAPVPVVRQALYSVPMLDSTLGKTKGKCRACARTDIPRSDWREHATVSCPVRFHPCTEAARGCTFSGTQQQLIQHTAETCAWTEFPCGDCGTACLLRSEMVEHASTWCVRRKIKCDNQGCSVGLLEADIASHQRTCPWRLVSCTGLALGCISRHPFKLRASHKASCLLAQHVDQLERLRTENANLRERLNQVDPTAAAEIPTPEGKRQKKHHHKQQKKHHAPSPAHPAS